MRALGLVLRSSQITGVGVVSAVSTVVSLLMQAQVDAAMAQAQIVTGRRMLRLDTIAREGRFRTPADDFVPFHALN